MTRSLAEPRAGRPARVALLGCGTVGRHVARRLLDAPLRPGLSLVKVLVRNPGRDRGLPPDLFTSRFEDILDVRPDVVIELLGGLDPAAACVAGALSRGIPVATANKSLIAHHGTELSRVGERCGAGLAFEASVCAGVPVLAALEQLRGDRVRSIRAILSGSCNYILGRMSAGASLDRAIAEARERGLVEPDPASDLSARDAAEKVSVLAAAAGFAVRPEEVDRQGIEGLSPEDFRVAREGGRVIKLVAELDFEVAPRFRVGPTLVAREHALAAVGGEENAVQVNAELAGELFFRGKGAGPGPTTSAVLGDVVRLLAGATGPAARAGPASCSIVAVRRTHLVRVSRAGGQIAPERVLREVRAAGARVRQIELSRTMIHIETRGQSAEEAVAAARSIADGDERRIAVLPVL